MSLPYTRFYWSDWIAATAHLSLVEIGAYMRLLQYIYQNKRPIPDDEKLIYRIGNATKKSEQKSLNAVLLEFFVKENHPKMGSVWRHPRAEKEIDFSLEKHDKNKRHGEVAAEGRWGTSIKSETPSMTRSQRLAAAREKGTHTQREWIELVDICGNHCLICGATTNIVKDHIQPIYQGGSDAIQNLQPLCKRCNSSKGPSSIDHRPADIERLLKQTSNDCSNASLTPNNQNQNQSKRYSPDGESATSGPEATPAAKRQATPFREILEIYREALPMCEQPLDVEHWTPARKATIRARWRDQLPDLDSWRECFELVAESKFLTGQSHSPGRKPFTASLFWIAKPENLLKIYEGKYRG